MNYLQQYLVDEFVEDYQEGLLSRRQALKRIGGITGIALATQLLAACGQVAQPATPATQAPGVTQALPPTAAPITAEAAVTEPPAPPSAAATATSAASTTTSTTNSVPVDDPGVVAQPIRFAGADAELMGYLARPSGEGTFAACAAQGGAT